MSHACSLSLFCKVSDHFLSRYVSNIPSHSLCNIIPSNPLQLKQIRLKSIRNRCTVQISMIQHTSPLQLPLKANQKNKMREANEQKESPEPNVPYYFSRSSKQAVITL